MVIGCREFFPRHLALNGGKEIIEVLRDQGFDIETLFSPETEEGLVETRENSRKYADFFDEIEDVDGVLVTLPNFGDEKAVLEVFKISNIDVPVLVHAFPDEREKMDRKHRRDAFCGKISVCNNLYQAGIPFTNTTKHVEDPRSEEFKKDLDLFERVCRTVNGLKDARLGVVGLRPNPFQTVRYSEKILESEGISVENLELIEILEGSKVLDEDSPEVQEKLEQVEDQFSLKDIPEEDVVKTAKLAISLSKWSERNELDAISFQCWPSIEEYYGISPCGAMSMMSESLRPAACESDVMGSLSMYALQLASGQPVVLIDLNNNYGEDPDKFVAFHCSNFPKSFFRNEECELGYHEIQECYGACGGRIASGPATFFRLSTSDRNGEIRAYIAEGKFTDDELESFGGYGVAKVNGLQSLLDFISTEGFEHHTAVVQDHVGDVLEEALENYLGWKVYRHSSPVG